jgi:hypothetical protein
MRHLECIPLLLPWKSFRPLTATETVQNGPFGPGKLNGPSGFPLYVGLASVGDWLRRYKVQVRTDPIKGGLFGFGTESLWKRFGHGSSLIESTVIWEPVGPSLVLHDFGRLARPQRTTTLCAAVLDAESSPSCEPG